MADTAPDSLISISSSAADARISAHDGDVALLYIYRQRTGCNDLERAARDLCRTMREIEAAAEKLSRLDLTASSAAPAASAQPAAARKLPPAPAEELPEYTSEDIIRRVQEDPEIAAIFSEADKVLGRKLGTQEMKKLFPIYDYLRLPTDVIMMLLHYCAKCFEERYGSQRRPSMNAIEKEAYHWVNNDIVTAERAEEYIRQASERRGKLAQVLSVLGIKGREPTKTESGYIGTWLDMGFDAQTIGIAYDRTVTNTGSLKWSYMNRIIASWNEKGLRTAADIEEKDSRTRKTDKRPEARGSSPENFRGLDSLLDKI